MRMLLIPASCGLLLGMALSAARLISPDGLRDTLRFRPSHALKAALWALGTAIAAMALLCWLAVMDIDRIVPAASRGDAGWRNAVRRVRGAVRLYAGDGAARNCVAKADACAVCGAGVSGGRVVCAVCANRSDSRTLGSACGDTLSHDTDRAVLVWRRIFQQGCIGLALMLLGLLMPSGVCWTRQIPPEKPTESAEPETFVALLPGEEPMVVEIPPEDAEIDDELHHLPPEDEVEEIDGSPEEENLDEPTGILPDGENVKQKRWR